MNTSTPSSPPRAPQGETQPARCDCIRRTNEALQSAYPGVRVLVNVANGRPCVATVRVSGKGKPPTLFPTFCPFCGLKYED